MDCRVLKVASAAGLALVCPPIGGDALVGRSREAAPRGNGGPNVDNLERPADSARENLTSGGGFDEDGSGKAGGLEPDGPSEIRTPTGASRFAKSAPQDKSGSPKGRCFGSRREGVQPRGSGQMESGGLSAAGKPNNGQSRT